MNRMPRLLLCLLFIVVPLTGRAAALSPRAEEAVASFMEERMLLALCPDDGGALSRIDRFESSLGPLLSTCTDEERLVLSNLLLLERYNYMRADPSRTDWLKEAFVSRNEQVQAWLSSPAGGEPDKWLCVTAGDIISVCMSFDPVRMALKYGTSVKKLYERALSRDPGFSYALMNLAQWYWYAPAILGGGKRKARSYFEKALGCAEDSASRYFALVFLSQAAFDGGEADLCAKCLSEADAFVPGGAYVARVRSLNASGVSLFTAMSRREGL